MIAGHYFEFVAKIPNSPDTRDRSCPLIFERYAEEAMRAWGMSTARIQSRTSTSNSYVARSREPVVPTLVFVMIVAWTWYSVWSSRPPQQPAGAGRESSSSSSSNSSSSSMATFLPTSPNTTLSPAGGPRNLESRDDFSVVHDSCKKAEAYATGAGKRQQKVFSRCLQRNVVSGRHRSLAYCSSLWVRAKRDSSPCPAGTASDGPRVVALGRYALP